MTEEGSMTVGHDGDVRDTTTRREFLASWGVAPIAIAGTASTDVMNVEIVPKVRAWEHPDPETSYHMVSELARLNVTVQEWGDATKITVEKHTDEPIADGVVSKSLDGTVDTEVVEYGTPITVAASTGEVFFEGRIELENDHLVDWGQDYPRSYAPGKLKAVLVQSEVEDG